MNACSALTSLITGASWAPSNIPTSLLGNCKMGMKVMVQVTQSRFVAAGSLENDKISFDAILTFGNRTGTGPMITLSVAERFGRRPVKNNQVAKWTRAQSEKNEMAAKAQGPRFGSAFVIFFALFMITPESLARHVFSNEEQNMITEWTDESARGPWTGTDGVRAVEQWKRKLNLADPRRYRPGSELFVSGASNDAGYLIARGIVALYYPLPDGRETLFQLAYPGELVNLTSLEPTTPTSTAGTAVTNCDVYRIDARSLETAERADPEVRKLFNRSLHAQIARRTKALVEIKGLSPADRLERYLCELAAVLGSDTKAKPVRVSVPLRDTELAMLLGLSERQFKRVKKSLQEEGRLTVENSRMFILPEC